MNKGEEFTKILEEQPVVMAKIGEEEANGHSMVALVADDEKVALLIGGSFDPVMLMAMIDAVDDARDKLMEMLIAGTVINMIKKK